MHSGHAGSSAFSTSSFWLLQLQQLPGGCLAVMQLMLHKQLMRVCVWRTHTTSSCSSGVAVLGGVRAWIDSHLLAEQH